MARRGGEYSANPGTPGRRDDGSGKFLSPRERARVERIKAQRTSRYDAAGRLSPEDQEAREAAVEAGVDIPATPDYAARGMAEADELTNRYASETDGSNSEEA